MIDLGIHQTAYTNGNKRGYNFYYSTSKISPFFNDAKFLLKIKVLPPINVGSYGVLINE